MQKKAILLLLISVGCITTQSIAGYDALKRILANDEILEATAETLSAATLECVSLSCFILTCNPHNPDRISSALLGAIMSEVALYAAYEAMPKWKRVYAQWQNRPLPALPKEKATAKTISALLNFCGWCGLMCLTQDDRLLGIVASVPSNYLILKWLDPSCKCIAHHLQKTAAYQSAVQKIASLKDSLAQWKQN